MARSIASRPTSQTITYRQPPNTPGVMVDQVEFWRTPKGINNLGRVSQISTDFAVSITNLMLDEGYMRSRKGIEAVGNADDRIQAVLSFTPMSGSPVLLRIRTDGVDSWNGNAWLPVVDIILHGNADDKFTWTGWGNELLLCNGADKIISYNPVSGVVKTLEESSPAKHLTSFNGRVVASAVTDGSLYNARVRWCVKLNNLDWTAETTTDAVGAGYEDLLAAPGGYVDEVMGVFPLSDETALMVRENSLWLVLVTGDVTAPFRFSRMNGTVGCRARRAIALSPFGVIFPTMEEIVLCDQSGPKPIGSGMRRGFFPTVADFDDLVAEYDPRRKEYRLGNGQDVWRYNFMDQGWTHDRYQQAIRHMSFISYRTLGLPIDDLVGTIDELLGTIDNLNLPYADEGIDMVAPDVVVREDVDITADNTLPSPLEIVTGLLAAGSVREKTTLLEAQLEYECEEPQRLIFEYSVDKGVTWNPYSYVDIGLTTGPQILSVRRTLTSHNIQVKVRSDSLGKLSLITLALFEVREAMVKP